MHHIHSSSSSLRRAGNSYRCQSNLWFLVLNICVCGGGDCLLRLNSNHNYDLLHSVHNDPDTPCPYTQYNISSPYHDENSLSNCFSNSKTPLFLSLNTQSLHSKCENIKTLFSLLSDLNICVDVLALQETWRIHYTELVQIPGYTFIHQHRTSNKGGGVGFYIKQGITFKVIQDLSLFTDNLFESLTIEAKISNKSYLLSTIYRSTTPPKNTTQTEHLTQFTAQLDTLLSNTNRRKLNTYVFLDSNINLLNLNTDISVSNYHDTILNNGFVQLITRATRIQNNHYSLIDHILSNSPNPNTKAGILLSDISDHFFTLTSPSYTKITHNPPSRTARNFNANNIANFKHSLRAQNWQNVYTSNTATDAFDNFWINFKRHFDTHFPICTFKSNKNRNRLKNFLTPELLESRKLKNYLHKLALSNPTPTNTLNYRRHRNLYNTAVRQSKALYYETNLAQSRKDPKRTWQLLKEAANLNTASSSITELNINGTLSSNTTEIANSLNDFFSTIGTTISNTIPFSHIDPISYCTEHPDVPKLDFVGTGQCQVGDVIKSLTSKSSTDLDGISTKILKSVRSEIEAPLAYTFNLSLTTGDFHLNSKLARSYLFTRQVILLVLTVTTTGH